MSKRIEDRQQSQRKSHDKQKPFREFKEEDKVYIRDFTSSSLKWTDGVIAEVTGPLSYQIKLTDGSLVYRHVDSVKQRD